MHQSVFSRHQICGTVLTFFIHILAVLDYLHIERVAKIGDLISELFSRS